MKKPKVIHINSTSKGGGVADLLSSLVKKLGHDWKVLTCPKWYYCYTKALHNFVQGKKKVKCSKRELTILKSMKDKKLEKNLREIGKNNKDLIEKYDIIVLHDPQPLPICEFKKNNQKIIWRCHIDYQRGLPDIYNKYFKNIDIVIAHRKFPKLKHKKIKVIKPGTNPLSEKNKPLSNKEYKKLIKEMGISHLKNKFKIVEVSRFDPWKGQDILIKAFISLKLKNAVLMLAGDFAKDDREAPYYIKNLKKYASKSKNIIFLESYSNKHINALHRFADVVTQPSIREGYGLTVSEALIKGKPVIASDIPAFRDQIKHGVNGFLFKNDKELKSLLKKCYNNPKILKNLPMSMPVRTVKEVYKDWQKLLKEIKFYYAE